MIKLVSKVYRNQKISFGSFIVEFKNGEALVDETVAKKIFDSKFPNIYKDGEVPQPKIDKGVEIDEEDKDVEMQELRAENGRLQSIIESLKIDKQKALDEAKTWKEEYNKLAEASKEKPFKINPEEEEEVIPSVEDEEEKLKETLMSKTVAELKNIAVSTPELNIDEKQLVGKKKEDIVHLIMGK